MYQDLTKLVNELDHTTPLGDFSKKGYIGERYKLQEIIKLCKTLRQTLIDSKLQKYPRKQKSK